MNTATTRLPTKPSLFRRIVRAYVMRTLRTRERSLKHTIEALELGTEADRLQLNQLNRMGMKNLVLHSRYANEMDELKACRDALAGVRKEISRKECAQ